MAKSPAVLTQVVATAVWGGLLALERRAILQAMVSRPLVAGVVTGLLLDDVPAGLFVGALFELVHLGGASLGGAHADHELLPTVTGVALAAGVGRALGLDASPAAWTVGVLVAAPLGRAGLRLEQRLDQRARKYYGRALTAVDEQNLRKVARQNLRALWPQFVFVALACGAAVLLAPALGHAVARLPAPVLRGLAWAFPALGAAAGGLAVQGSHAARRVALGALGAATVAASAWLLNGGPPP